MGLQGAEKPLAGVWGGASRDLYKLKLYRRLLKLGGWFFQGGDEAGVALLDFVVVDSHGDGFFCADEIDLFFASGDRSVEKIAVQ